MPPVILFVLVLITAALSPFEASASDRLNTHGPARCAGGSYAEQQVCRDPELAAWERALASIRDKLAVRTQRWGSEQAYRDWLEERDQCRTLNCLRAAYKQIIGLLLDRPTLWLFPMYGSARTEFPKFAHDANLHVIDAGDDWIVATISKYRHKDHIGTAHVDFEEELHIARLRNGQAQLNAENSACTMTLLHRAGDSWQIRENSGCPKIKSRSGPISASGLYSRQKAPLEPAEDRVAPTPSYGGCEAAFFEPEHLLCSEPDLSEHARRISGMYQRLKNIIDRKQRAELRQTHTAYLLQLHSCPGPTRDAVATDPPSRHKAIEKTKACLAYEFSAQLDLLFETLPEDYPYYHREGGGQYLEFFAIEGDLHAFIFTSESVSVRGENTGFVHLVDGKGKAKTDSGCEISFARQSDTTWTIDQEPGCTGDHLAGRYVLTKR